MYIRIERTPNPNTFKFVPGILVSPRTSQEFKSKEEAATSEIASLIMAIDGVSSVFLGYDFVSVSSEADNWHAIKPLVIGSLIDCIKEGKLENALANDAPESNASEIGAQDEDIFFDERDREIVDKIRSLIDTRVRPAVASDGGDVLLRGYRDNIVFVTMRGACMSCPSAEITLKHGVSKLLSHFLPEYGEFEVRQV